jgi:hypothetical protein
MRKEEGPLMTRPTEPAEKNLNDLPSILIGVSGVHFVAAELSRLGYVASVTLRNTRGIDILATNASASCSVGIQVKTNRRKQKKWLLDQKAEGYQSKTLFYVFVNLKGLGQLPDYHVVPSGVVARFITEDHRAWLTQPNRAGGSHRDNRLRVFRDGKNEYLGRWDLLGL